MYLVKIVAPDSLGRLASSVRIRQTIFALVITLANAGLFKITRIQRPSSGIVKIIRIDICTTASCCNGHQFVVEAKANARGIVS